jgi:transposase
MGQRCRILTQIVGVPGFRVASTRWERPDGTEVVPGSDADVFPETVLVIRLERRWRPRCGACGEVVRKVHEQLPARRWQDLPAIGHPVILEYAPIRGAGCSCGKHAVEHLPWAAPKQRQTKRLQQHIAFDAASMPLSHVAVKYGLSWQTVRRAETEAIARWAATRPPKQLTQVGVDEKWLGRRHKRPHKFVTIVSDLDTGEPVWMGYGRDSATLRQWTDQLSPEQRASLRVVAADMHEPFMKAVRETPGLEHVGLTHDPFHVLKRAGEAVTELRRAAFFRAGAEMRSIGRGTRWLVLRRWDRCSPDDQATLRRLFQLNGKLARAYQLVEELRAALATRDPAQLGAGLMRILRRTERRDNIPMRALHDSIDAHYQAILNLAKYDPPTGRIEALNNNWETLVRRGRGYRNIEYLFRKLRFATANPVRAAAGARRFLALGIPVPQPMAA